MNLMKASVLSALLVTSSTFSNDKIVGGERVQDISESPYLVNFRGGCGGTIIDKNWILSAAHCRSVFTRGAKTGVLDKNEAGLSLDVEEVIIHPDYNASALDNDYALIKLSTPIQFEEGVIEPALIADADYDAAGFQAPGTMATVYGWGVTREGGWSGSRYLMKVEVPIVSNEEANEEDSYDGDITENMITAGYKEGGKDACQGDSGGPMVTFNADYKPVLVGVVSWGQGCAREDKYGVYSRVSAAYEWIQQTMNSH